MERCSYPAEGAQQHEGLPQRNCMDREEDMNMKTPKLGNGNNCGVGDMYLMGGSSSSSSSLSLSSTTDSSSCKSSFKSKSRSRSRSSSFSKPSWLLSTLSHLDDKMKNVTLNNKNSMEIDTEGGDKNEDSFAQRAEAYYRTRPQLLSLLNDLYNGYVSLADRYSQTLAKHNRSHQFSSPISAVHFDDKLDDYCHDDQEEEVLINTEHMGSEADSSVSYQGPFSLNETIISVDLVVAELVVKMVDFDIIVDELGVVEKRWNESSRKIELQGSLLDVLESERVILLNENSRLGYEVAMLGEENKTLLGENMFMKRKAGELARCVLKMREDHRVRMLIRKIEDLQGQILTLEKRNKDYYHQIVQRDSLLLQFQNQTKKSGKNGNKVPTLGDRFQVDERTEEEEKVVSKSIMKKLGSSGSDNGRSGRKLSEWWGRVKNLDLLQCGPHFKH